MNTSIIILIVVGIGGLAAAMWVVYAYVFKDSSGGNMESLRQASRSMPTDQAVGGEAEFMRAKQTLAKRKKTTKKKITIEEQFFQAGIVTPKQIKKFKNLQLYAPIIGMGVLGYGGFMVSGMFAAVGLIFGGLVGLQLPKSILERKIAARGEDIMFFLPLVIEQIAIGVSSSLDIGPCLQKVVSMAEERDSHNVVTEFLRLVVTLSKSGFSLEDALLDVGQKSGHLELNQTFGALAQVVRHGGEITKQLQEMADAVSTQRETKIEAKIKKLELEATGPVALVFMGFLLILLTCIGMQMIKAFG